MKYTILNIRLLSPSILQSLCTQFISLIFVSIWVQYSRFLLKLRMFFFVILAHALQVSRQGCGRRFSEMLGNNNEFIIDICWKILTVRRHRHVWNILRAHNMYSNVLLSFLFIVVDGFFLPSNCYAKCRSYGSRRNQGLLGGTGTGHMKAWKKIWREHWTAWTPYWRCRELDVAT